MTTSEDNVMAYVHHAAYSHQPSAKRTETLIRQTCEDLGSNLSKVLNRTRPYLIGAAVGIIVLSAAPPFGKADTWRGTGPFCKGQCLPGETEIQRSSSGNGANCWSGTKALCRNMQSLCTPKETRTSCYGVVLMCDNGFYKIPDVWTSCGTYACGACFGLP
jgi:hypothetical protein